MQLRPPALDAKRMRDKSAAFIAKSVDRVRKYRYTINVVLIKKAGLPHLGTYL
jgi:hypothetical protein